MLCDNRVRSICGLASWDGRGDRFAMRSPIDPGQRRRRRADVSPISGKVMLRLAGTSHKTTKEANAATEARLAAILEALPIEPAEKDD